MFSSIWSKVSAALTAIAGVFFFLFRMKSKQVKELKHEVKVKEAENSITEYYEEAETTERIKAEREIQRKAQVTRNANSNTLDDIIDNEL